MKGRDIIALSEEKIKDCCEALEKMSTSESDDRSDINFDSETLEYYTHFMNIYLHKGEVNFHLFVY